LGGRARMINFRFKKRTCGAGIGRYDKDHFLKNLLTELGMPIIPQKTNMKIYNIYTQTFSNQSTSKLKKILHHLKTQYNQQKNMNQKLDFKNFFLLHYSIDDYNWFKHQIGYTDFEQADILDTLDDYGFDDTFNDNDIFPVDWNQLISKLKSSLKYTKILRNSNVNNIDIFKKCVTINPNQKFHYSQLFFAGTKLSFASLFSKYSIFSEYINQIGTQPFLRHYIHTIPKMKFEHTTYINNSFQKIISFPDNVYMIYADNESAIVSNSMTNNEMEYLLHTKIDEHKKCFHLVGTHFYYPLIKNKWSSRKDFIHDLQKCNQHVFFIGEMISIHQGWTEGALSSVESVLQQYFSKSFKEINKNF
jgi:hypothetical protein